MSILIKHSIRRMFLNPFKTPVNTGFLGTLTLSTRIRYRRNPYFKFTSARKICDSTWYLFTSNVLEY
jgi:hypothetical protein